MEHPDLSPDGDNATATCDKISSAAMSRRGAMRRIGALGIAAIAPACTESVSPVEPAEAQVPHPAGSPAASIATSADAPLDTLLLKTPAWDGSFVTPIQYTDNTNTGWMPHPAGIGAFSFVQSGTEVFRFTETPAEVMITAPNTSNRFSFNSSQGFCFYARSGNFELEAPEGRELSLVGYRLASYSGKSIVVTTSASEPAVPLIVRGEGSVKLWMGQNNRYETVCAFDNAGNLEIGGDKVVGKRGAAVPEVSNRDAGAQYDAGAQALINELKSQVNMLLRRLRDHGLIEA
ncbi:MAG TPA: hypothetical protein VFD22_06750 [Gemmatimonadaceae bacterium]|nr:hypothetical protein [Gemmatimonadaceae bacterium]